MTKRLVIGAGLVMLTLGAPAAAEHISGYLTEVAPTNLCIRTRFRPNVLFTINSQTTFYCGREQVSIRILQAGDIVEVKFHGNRDEVIADKVKIQEHKKTCSARLKADAKP